MNKSLLLLTLLLLLVWRVKAGSVIDIYQFGVSEHEPFAFRVDRRGSTNQAVSVAYTTTTNGTAVPGVDYTAVSGRLVFAAGELSKPVVPLLDNGEVNGFADYKTIELRLFDVSPESTLAQTTGVAFINDDESPADVDLAFAPKFMRSPFITAVVVQPDGRILISGRELFLYQKQISLARLMPDGSVDPTFDPTAVPAGDISYLALTPDARIIIAGVYALNGQPFLTRLLADGRSDPGFRTPANGAGTPVAQHDGHILVVSSNMITRLLNDGSEDRDFNQNAGAALSGQLTRSWRLAAVHSLPSGRLIVIVRNDETGSNLLLRLLSDGTRDSTFNRNPWLMDSCFPTDVFVLRDSHLLVKVTTPRGTQLVKLDWSGLPDPTFTEPEELRLARARAVAEIDGYIYFDVGDSLVRTDFRGVLDRSFLIRMDTFLLNGGWGNGHPCTVTPMRVAAGGDALFIWGDGLAMNSVHRPLTKIPVKQRVFAGFAFESTPPIAYRSRVLIRNSEEVAEVQVKRLGSTSHAATVRYKTLDGTARADKDFAAAEGTLNFAPLEIHKTICINLLQGAPVPRKLHFYLALFDVSIAASLDPPIEVEIVPAELSIIARALSHRQDGSSEFEFEPTGVAPFQDFIVEGSNDLKTWKQIPVRSAGYFFGDILGPPSVSFDRSAGPEFFRLRPVPTQN